MKIKTKTSVLLTLLFLIFSACSTDEEIAPDDRPLGVSASSFLSDEDFTSLKVEIVYVTGYEPSATVLNTVQAFLQKYLNKPSGVTIQTRAIPSPGVGTYSLAEVKEVENNNRTAFTSGSKLTAFIFIADNKSDSSTQKDLVLGKAYKNTSLVIFDKEIRELSANSGVSSSEIEHTTIRHEFGHLFGLVNNGSPAQSPHEDPDPDHKAHCDVDGCLMSASLEFGTSTLNALKVQSQSMELDDKCHQDLIANGGK